MSHNHDDDVSEKEREERYEGRSGQFDKDENLDQGPIKCLYPINLYSHDKSHLFDALKLSKAMSFLYLISTTKQQKKTFSISLAMLVK